MYLDLAGLKKLTVIPSVFVDDVESVEAGWIDSQLKYWSKWIDGRLAKRYEVPFAAFDDTKPTPEIIQVWLSRIVTLRVMLKRGVDQNDEQIQILIEDDQNARAEIEEAANGKDALFDLPLNAENKSSAITRGGTFGYSESSPYVSSDLQRRRGRYEDGSGRGS